MSFLGINFAPKQSRVELHKFGDANSSGDKICFRYTCFCLISYIFSSYSIRITGQDVDISSCLKKQKIDLISIAEIEKMGTEV